LRNSQFDGLVRLAEISFGEICDHFRSQKESSESTEMKRRLRCPTGFNSISSRFGFSPNKHLNFTELPIDKNDDSSAASSALADSTEKKGVTPKKKTPAKQKEKIFTSITKIFFFRNLRIHLKQRRG